MGFGEVDRTRTRNSPPCPCTSRPLSKNPSHPASEIQVSGSFHIPLVFGAMASVFDKVACVCVFEKMACVCVFKMTYMCSQIVKGSRSNPPGKCSLERLTRGTVTSTMHRVAHPSGCARCGVGAGCLAIIHQSLSEVQVSGFVFPLSGVIFPVSNFGVGSLDFGCRKFSG